MKKALIILTLFVNSCTYVTVEPNKKEPIEPVAVEKSEVVLQSFTAVNNAANTASIKWITSKEVKVTNFELEMSKDLQLWNSSIKFNAHNKPSEYSTTQTRINNNTLYHYRLRVNYNDDTFKYTDTVSVRVTGIYL